MKTCRAYMPRPPPLPDPDSHALMWSDLRWKLRCIALPAAGILLWNILDPPSSPVHLEILYLHGCWSFAAYWWLGWMTFFKNRMGPKHYQLTLSSLDRWLAPIVVLWFWTLLDPVSATAHSQVLYLHVFGWWLGRWCHRRWNEVGVWMECTGYKTGMDEIQLRNGTVYRATLGKQIEARGYLVAYWTIGG